MGIFRKKKKTQAPGKLPEFPEFPKNKPGASAHLPPYDDHSQQEEQPPERVWKSPEQHEQIWRPPEQPPAQPEQPIEQHEPVFTKPRPSYQEREPTPQEPPMTRSAPPTQPPRVMWEPPVRQPEQPPQLPLTRQQEQPTNPPPGVMWKQPVAQPPQQAAAVEERPVFVKIQQYRDAMSSIELLKQKIKELDYLLERIEEIRTQEQQELGSFRINIEKIKEKLMAIDKKLFEV